MAKLCQPRVPLMLKVEIQARGLSMDSDCRGAVSCQFECSKLVLTGIEDNGNCITDHRGNDWGMGLHIMHYRAGTAGATLDIYRRPEGGTAVVCWIPSRISQEGEE